MTVTPVGATRSPDSILKPVAMSRAPNPYGRGLCSVYRAESAPYHIWELRSTARLDSTASASSVFPDTKHLCFYTPGLSYDLVTS